MVAIATKDFSKLLPKIKEAFPELIQIVIGCITEAKKIAEEDVELKFDKEEYCVNLCQKKYGSSICPNLLRCIESCLKTFKSS